MVALPAARFVSDVSEGVAAQHCCPAALAAVWHVAAGDGCDGVRWLMEGAERGSGDEPGVALAAA